MNNFLSVFKAKKPIIAMLHLDALQGEPGFISVSQVVERARRDIEKLQTGGVDGIIIENWKQDSDQEFVSSEVAECLTLVCKELLPFIQVPFGINVLNNDYKVALEVAKLTGASFVELDVLVDKVQSDFSHSEAGQKNPFVIDLNPKDVFDYAKEIGAEDIPIICFVQPKHYTMLDKNKMIETSVAEAEMVGVAGVLVTKATGFAPTLEIIEKAKMAAKNIPVGIGSGFSIENAGEFLPVVDFVVVGSALKIDGNVDNEVDEKKVKQLMGLVADFRKSM